MAEETITITLGSRDEKRERFYDIPYYPIKPGKIIKWSNADNIPHEIEILSQTNVTSKNLKSILKILFPLNLEKKWYVYISISSISWDERNC